MRPSRAFPLTVAAALVVGSCAEMFQPIPPPDLPTAEPPALTDDPLAPPAGPAPTDAPPLRFVAFEAAFDPAISTTRYEIFVVDPIGFEIRSFWRMRFERGVCGDLQWSEARPSRPREPRETSTNGYVHDGCDVDVVERGAKVEVQVVRAGDLTPSGGLRPGARYLLYVRSARAGDSAETRAWPLDEVISRQTVP